MLRKRAITTFLSRKFIITRSSIAFEDFLGSSIAPQVMPPCNSSFIIISTHMIFHCYHQDLNQPRQFTSILALYLSLATSRLITHHFIRIVIITNNQGLYSNVTKPGPTPFRSQILVPPAQYLPHQTSLTGLG